MDDPDPVADVISAVAAADRLVNRMSAWRDALLAEAFRSGAAVRRAELSLRLSDTAAWEWARTDMVAELALALRFPESTVSSRIRRTAVLTRCFPRLAEAHAAGEVSRWHVEVMLELFERYPQDVRSAADEALTPRARALDPSRFRSTARRWRARHAGPVTPEARRAAVADRHVTVTPADDHLAWLSALLPAEQAYAAFHRISDLAAEVQEPDESRTLPQLRADVMSALLIDPDAPDVVRQVVGAAVEAPDEHQRAFSGLDERAAVRAVTPGDGDTAGIERPARSCQTVGRRAGADGRGSVAGRAAVDGRSAVDGRGSVAGRAAVDGRVAVDGRDGGSRSEPDRWAATRSCLPDDVRGIRATVVLTVPALTLLGHGDEPAVLEGHGPIDIETARRLVADAPSFIRVLTDPHTGAVLCVGRRRYAVPADLRTALTVRDVTCRFPGCSRRAARCDLDHSTSWAAGGETAIDNLAHLCRKHHRLKHLGRWRVRHEPGGVLVWTTPSGRQCRDEPAVRMDASPPVGASSGRSSPESSAALVYPDAPVF